jgi:hypothetical protein
VETVIVGTLLVLSALLTFSIVFPHLDVRPAGGTLIGLLVLTLASLGAARGRGRPTRHTAGDGVSDRATWTMPPIETLAPPTPARSRTVGLVVLRIYFALGGSGRSQDLGDPRPVDRRPHLATCPEALDWSASG